MLQPKRDKYRRQHRPNPKGIALRGCFLSVGEFGLQSLGKAWLTARQIESARKTIVRETKRKGKLWMRVFPDRPITQKPPEVTMGAGKGDVDHYIMALKPGRIMFELGGVSEDVARSAFKKAAQKLPILTKFVMKS